MRYEAVLFDVGGTLIGPRVSFGSVYAEVFRPLGLERSEEEFEQALRVQWQAMDRLIPRGSDRYSHFPGGEAGYWRRFVHGALQRVAQEDPPPDLAGRALDALREAFRRGEVWRLFDDVLPTLEALRRAGVRLGVVSNWDSRLPALLDRLKLASHFDSVTVSSLEGVEKPDPEIFRRALAALGAEPRSAIHVGDLPEIDLLGARAAGLLGVLVDRHGRLDPALGALPDLRPLPGLAGVGSD